MTPMTRLRYARWNGTEDALFKLIEDATNPPSPCTIGTMFNRQSTKGSQGDAASKQPRRGVHLAFSNLTFTVKDQASGDDKRILSGISGAASPGRLFALMGASGAGKTTLLDILACNVYSGTLQGDVLVDGKPRDSRAFLRTSCYVMQKDLLYASATVRECITTSALLRLPLGMPHHTKLDRVEEVIRELELEQCASTLIGDETLGIKGISGGQKRRVSLAIELVKDPAVIFADEPTSGLDSEVALSIMDALLMLARKQRTVICTIHQPNSDITDLFDDFMLLARGRCVYAGPWSTAVDWFAGQGHQTPTYKNPTDFFMSVIKVEEAAMKLANAFEASRASSKALLTGDQSTLDPAPKPPPQATASLRGQDREGGRFVAVDFSTAGNDGVGVDGRASGKGGEAGVGQDRPSSSSAFSVGPGLAVGHAASGGAAPQEGVQGGQGEGRGPWWAFGSDAEASERAPWWYQVVILYQRSIKNWVRNPIMLASEFVQYAVIAVFVGLMYLDFSNDANGIYDRAACIWFAFAVMSFTPSYTAVTSWHSERLLVSRELKQRQYGITPMYLSRTAVLLPAQLLQCLVFVAIMYFFVGFQPSADKFFIFFIVLSMFQLISEGLGLLCAIVTRHPTYAVIMLTFILLLLLSFSGFLMSSIPVYFIWVNKASYLTYAYTSLMQSQLEGLRVTDPQNPDTTVDAMALMPPVLDNGLTMPQNIGILASQWAFMELLKVLALYGASWGGLI